MKEKKTRKLLGILILLSFSFVLLWFNFKGLDISAFKSQFYSLDWSLTLAAGFSMLASLYFRNLRWLMLLRRIKPDLRASHSIIALLIGYPANLIIPQSGIIIRANYLLRKDKMLLAKTLGTVVAEKLLDTLVVFPLFFLMLIFANKDYNFVIFEPWVLGIALILFVFIRLIIKYFRNHKNFRRQTVFFRKNLLRMSQGFNTLKAIKANWRLYFYTLAIWITYIYIFYLLLWAGTENRQISFKLATEVSTMGNISWIFPTQAGIGSFHILVSETLILNDFTRSISVFLATWLHGIITLYDLLFGIIAFVVSYFWIKTK